MACGRFLAAGALVGTLLYPPSTFAQSDGRAARDNSSPVQGSSNREHAKQLYEEGLSAYRSGKFSDAVDKLLEADRLMPNAAFSYNIALVYQAMGDKRSALRWLRSYLRQSDKKDDQATIEKVRGLEAELQSKGLQQITVISKPPGATLKIDGNALGITPFTLEITPGMHQAYLSLDGYQGVQRTFELRPDRSMDLDIDLLPVAQGAAPAPMAPPPPALVEPSPITAPPADYPRPSRRIQPVTWVSLGIGTALFGGALFYELRRESAERDAKTASQAEYQATYDRMHSAQTAARILAVAGSVGLAAGFVLLTVDLSHSRPTQTAFIGNCGSSGICAALKGRF